jgi:hypothetical protein
MKVQALQLFLHSLRSAVKEADNSSSLPADLEAVSIGLEPFAALDFSQLAAFLRQAEQYRASGAVSVPSPASLAADKVQESLRGAASLVGSLSAAGEIDMQHVTAEWEKTRHGLQQALAALLKPLAIDVTFKGTQQQFKSALKVAQESARTRALTAQMQAALNGVTDEASLNAPERQEKLRAVVDRLQPADLKAIAKELGAPASGRTKETLLSTIIEHVTGFKPSAKKATQSSQQPAVDQAAVQQQAVKLKGLLEKSLDPGGLRSVELEGAMRELETRSGAELEAIAKEVGLEKPGKKKEGILKKIREKLEEADRIRESIQV